MNKTGEPNKLLKSHRSVVASTRGMSTGMFLGSSFAVATGGLGWLGHLADGRLGTDPWLAVGGVFLGFLYGGVEVWKLTRETDQKEVSSERAPSAESRTDTGS